MLIIRRSQLSDIDCLLELSSQTGGGMTTMPNDRDSWEQKLTLSDSDFSKIIETPDGEIYFMVQEDSETKKIVGSCAIYAGIGHQVPFYNYKISTISQFSHSLGKTKHLKILNLVNDFKGASELGSLFLLPDYRHNQNGRFLSRSRFMLIADFPKRFDELIFAEMRGYLDENNRSPFWDHFTSKFFDLSYDRANFINSVDGTQFISDLMPKFPIYLDLLDDKLKAVIGRTNDDTIGAIKILQKEGLQFRDYIDIFDGGPVVQADVHHINTIANSHVSKVVKIVDDSVKLGERYIISNCAIDDYRIVAQPLLVDDNNEITINQSTASALNIELNASIRCIKL